MYVIHEKTLNMLRNKFDKKKQITTLQFYPLSALLLVLLAEHISASQNLDRFNRFLLIE